MGLPGVGFALAPWLERESSGCVGPQATPAAATALLQHCKAEPRRGNKGSHEPLDFWTRRSDFFARGRSVSMPYC